MSLKKVYTYSYLILPGFLEKKYSQTEYNVGFTGVKTRENLEIIGIRSREVEFSNGSISL